MALLPLALPQRHSAVLESVLRLSQGAPRQLLLSSGLDLIPYILNAQQAPREG